MKNLEMKIEGEKLLIRHPDGVVVMVDFSDVRPDLAAGAVTICGVRMAAKAERRPRDVAPASLGGLDRKSHGEPAASGGQGFALPPTERPPAVSP